MYRPFSDDMEKSVEAFLDRFLMKAPLLVIDVEESTFEVRFEDAELSFLFEDERHDSMHRTTMNQRISGS